MTEQLWEVIVILEENVDNYLLTEENGASRQSWTVEISIDAGTMEGAVKKFITENNVPDNLGGVLYKIGVEYGESLDSNVYFSRYGSLLNSSKQYEISAHHLLEILQGLYHYLNEFLRPAEIRESALKSINETDSRILKYMAGFMLRKLYYHKITPVLEKAVLLALRCDVRGGSIADERNRGSVDSAEKLWGATQLCVNFFEFAEKAFRHHVLQEPHLEIDDEMTAVFLALPEIEDLQNSLHLQQDEDVVKGPLRKLFEKFIKVRAHSYSHKLKNAIEKTTKAQPSRGLRKQLKSRKSNCD